MRRQVAIGAVWLALAMAFGGLVLLELQQRRLGSARAAVLGRCAQLDPEERACCLGQVRAEYFAPL